MTSATVCVSQTLTFNHFISRSHPLLNLFISLQPFTRPVLMEHQNEDFFFLSVSPVSSSCLSLFFLSLSFSLLSQGIGVGVRFICVLHGNFKKIGMVWLEQVITQLVCLSFLPKFQHMSSFSLPFPVNHSLGCSYWNKPMHLVKTHRKWYCYLLIPHWLSGYLLNSKECSVHNEKWDI